MDKAQFGKIKQYGAMLAIASHLHKRGLITDAEHHKLTAKLQKKYRPVDSSPGSGSPAPKDKKQKEILRKEDLRKNR